MKGRVVLAEDDPNQAKIVKLYLEREGHSVVVADNGLAALEEVRRREPDLLVLDVMMPKLDGHDVCRILRRESDVPILLLTARSTEDDVLIGLDLGADDYVTKPYRPRELMARVRALLRRAGNHNETTDEIVRFADLELDRARRSVTVAGRFVELTAAEFDVLILLAASPGLVFTRLQLLEAVMGFDYRGMERTIDAHVKNLRRKLGDDARNPRYIATVVGVGYKAPTNA
ncbi:MAG: response regulator transcription factor [Acidimicrobiia bacterium]|nr:response regulator transcription factor [Acidimicrobiia bacterium]